MSSTEPADEKPVVLNMRSIENLQKLSAGNPTFVQSIFDAYFQQCERGIGDFEPLILEGDTTAIGDLAHKLKGGAAQLGALAMADTCKKLEQVGLSGSTEGAKGLVEKIQVDFERLRIAVAVLNTGT